MAPPTRTQRVLEWGEHRRGVWRPEEGSLTLRAYRWWAKSSGQAPKCLWVATAPVAWGLIAVLVALWVACEGTSRLSWWIFGYRIRGWRFVRPFTVMLAAGFLYLVASAWWVEASRTVLLAILIVGAGFLAMLAVAAGLAVVFVSVEAGVREWKERRPRPGVSLEKKAPSRRRASPLRRALEPFALVWAALRAWKMGICPIVEIPRSNSD